LCSVAFYVVNREDQHNHAQDKASVARGLLLKHVHKKIGSDPTETIRIVHDAAVIEISDDEFVPSFTSIRTRAQRMRSDYMPPIPASIDDVTIYNGVFLGKVKGFC